MLEKLKRFVRKYALRGRNVHCCLCNKKFITFLPAGDEMRAHARCPGCYAIDRHRQLWLTIAPILENVTKPVRLLHIAPEKPLAARLRKMKHVQYDAIDKFEKGYHYPGSVRNMDLTALSFADNAFDIFLCSHVLEHIQDDKKAMQELYRVLKPGGEGFIMVPYFPELDATYEDASILTPEQRKIKFGQHDHVRKYGADLVQKLNAIGFEVEVLSIENKYIGAEKIRLGLMHAEPVFHVRK